MAGYVPVHPIAGFTPANDIFTPSSTQLFQAGMVIDAVDPYFGYGRFVYGKAAASQVPGQLVYMDYDYTMTVMPSTANLGWNLYVARQVIGAAYWGWYQFEGNCPIKTDNSVAAGVAVGLGTTAGSAGTLSNGKQILGCRVLKASTFTITKANTTTKNGSKVLGVGNQNGLFYGLALSGTGIASDTLASLDPNGREISNTSASTATGAVTLTATYTGFLLCSINSPHSQGQVA